MSETAGTVTPTFSLAQHKTLRAWSAKRPRGFRVTLTHDDEAAEEIAKITQRAAHEFLYYLHPTMSGRVSLFIVECWHALEVDTVEEALEALLAREEELEVWWVANAM